MKMKKLNSKLCSRSYRFFKFSNFQFDIDFQKKGTFGKALSLPFGEIILTPNNLGWKENDGNPVLSFCRESESAAESYQK